MSADNAINGVPTCAERGLLTQVLRDQWGFQGFVVSDYDAWVFMAIRDGPTPFAKTVPEAAVLGEHDRCFSRAELRSNTDAVSQASPPGWTKKGAATAACRRFPRPSRTAP